MRLWTGTVACILLAGLAAQAGADDPGAGGPGAATPAGAPTSGAGAPAEAAAEPAAPAWKHAWVATGGLGFYERLHAGVAYQLSPAASLGALAGTNLGLGAASTWTVGLSYAHALHRTAEGWQMGLDGKALYWEQSNPDYDWDLLTLAVGAFFEHELRPRLSLVLDGGVALTLVVDSHRKQNVNFEYPTRWNGSGCVALRYRLEEW